MIELESLTLEILCVGVIALAVWIYGRKLKE